MSKMEKLEKQLHYLMCAFGGFCAAAMVFRALQYSFDRISALLLPLYAVLHHDWLGAGCRIGMIALYVLSLLVSHELIVRKGNHSREKTLLFLCVLLIAAWKTAASAQAVVGICPFVILLTVQQSHFQGVGLAACSTVSLTEVLRSGSLYFFDRHLGTKEETDRRKAYYLTSLLIMLAGSGVGILSVKAGAEGILWGLLPGAAAWWKSRECDRYQKELIAHRITVPEEALDHVTLYFRQRQDQAI